MADQTGLCAPAHAVTLSTHPTSEGLLRYRRCCCHRITVELLDWPEPPVVLGVVGVVHDDERG